jgi:aldehyde:ferredoxin oxidoreductase
MLPGYYEVRGWDEDGIPTRAKIEALGLEKYAFKG